MHSPSQINENRRVALAEAAIHILGTKGSRGLTHRAIDTFLALPLGSTSNYFRTRQAILAAAFERICELDLIAIERAVKAAETLPPGPQSAASLLERSLERYFLDPVQLERQRARQEVSLISANYPDLNRTVVGFRQNLRISVGEIFSGLGIAVPDVAIQVLIGFADGMIFDRIVGGRIEPLDGEIYRRTFLAIIRGVLPGNGNKSR